MTVSLRPVTSDTLDAVAALTVAAPQRGFVAANLYSLAQAAVMPGQIPRAVYADETPVGFVMYGFDTDEDAYCISRLMVDQAYQGKGYGRQAMALVLDDIRARQPRRGFAYISFDTQFFHGLKTDVDQAFICYWFARDGRGARLYIRAIP